MERKKGVLDRVGREGEVYFRIWLEKISMVK